MVQGKEGENCERRFVEFVQFLYHNPQDYSSFFTSTLP